MSMRRVASGPQRPGSDTAGTPQLPQQSPQLGSTGSMRKSTSLNTSAQSAITVLDVDRVCRNVEGLMRTLREKAAEIKSTEPFNTSRRTFSEWSADLGALATKVDDVLYEFRRRGQDPSPPPATTPSKGRKFNIADVVSQLKKSQGDAELPVVDESVELPSPRSNVLTPQAGGRAPKPPRQGLTLQPNTGRSPGMTPTHAGSAAAAAGAGAATARPKAGASGAGSRVVAENPQYAQASAMAASLHLLLDAAMRAVQGSSATLYVPVNGNLEHLEAVCDVGRGPDTVLSQLVVKDPNSAPALAAATGIMITVCRGHDPAADNPQSAAAIYNAASNTFRESVRMALSPTASRSNDVLDVNTVNFSENGSPKHAIIAPVSKTPKRSTSVWSSVSVPLVQHAGQQPAAVLHVVNKLGGRANFEPEDEHVLFGIGNTFASLLQRIESPRAVARFYQPARPMLPVQQPPKPQLRVRGEAVEEPHFGFKQQLVWRTWDHPGSVREVKVLVKGSAVKLDERVPVMRVYDYVEQLQTSWRRSALLNVEYQQAFDQRTAYITMLVHKLKTAAHKNEALRAMVTELRGGPPKLPDGLPLTPAAATPAGSGGDDDDDGSDARYAAARPYFLPPKGLIGGDEDDAEAQEEGQVSASQSPGQHALLASTDSEDLIRAVEAEQSPGVLRKMREREAAVRVLQQQQADEEARRRQEAEAIRLQALAATQEELDAFQASLAATARARTEHSPAADDESARTSRTATPSVMSATRRDDAADSSACGSLAGSMTANRTAPAKGGAQRTVSPLNSSALRQSL